MQLFEGLHLYELVLLFLGVLLFLVTVFLLLYFVFQKRPVKNLTWLFLVAIIMIGFPSFQKISFGNGLLELEKRMAEVSANPTDAGARQALTKQISVVEQRPLSNQTLVTLARANAVAGDTVKATRFVDSVLTVRPAFNEAIKLRDSLQR